MLKRFRHTALACAMACGLTLDLAAQTPPTFVSTAAPAAQPATAGLPPGMQSREILLPQGAGPQSVNSVDQQADPAQLKIYEVPSDLIGAVGARLQITYHGQPRVRVATEPKTGQLMVMAPESIQRDIASKMQLLIFEARQSGLVTDDKGMSVASTKQQVYSLRNLRPVDLENALQRLAGPRLTATTERNGEVATFRLASETGMHDVMQIDRTAGHVLLLGGGPSVAGWMQIIYALDVGQSDPLRATHVMPLAPADPQRVRQAVQLVRAVFQQQSQDEDVTTQVVPGGRAPTRPGQAGNQPPGTDEQASAIGTMETLGAETGLFGDVQIEFIEDLDLVIIKGSKRDVQRTLEVIDQIKKKSAETQPEIRVMQLKHVDSTAVATLVNELYEEVLKPRQGTVSITSLGQPNALLLIGRKEAVASVEDLINKLDQPLDPANQLRVFRLLHASAVDAETTIRDFFTDTPGSGDDLRTGLGTRVKLIADYRTNSLIVQAAPRDLAEVAKLIEQIDVEGTPAQNEVRIFRLKNAIAADLQTVLESVITGTPAEGGGGGGGGGGETTPPSTKLSIIQRAARVDSGILAGVIITADPSQNALVVRAPSKSMELINQLITELDQLPSAEAQIKVFEVKNGDATALAVTLQQLFGLPVTAGQNPTGGVLGLGNQLQLAGLTTGGEGALVQLRVTVDTRTNSIIVSGSPSDLQVIEVLLLRLDEEGVETRKTEVFWLRNANAADVANALTQFLNTQRQVIQQQLLLNQAISIF
ncbi:MAG: secretin N-terminal domain-containing protein, partial [Aureliella sp.]